MPQKKQTLIGDLVAAFMLLSRLPCSWYKFSSTAPPQIGSAGWAFPVVGFVIGSSAGVTLSALKLLGVTELIAAAVALVVITLLTGAMHDDGLADTADGFGGGHNINDKIRIMHDSNIGSYGVMSLCLSCILRVTLMANLASQEFSSFTLIVTVALISAGARWQILFLLRFYPISESAKLARLTEPPSTLQFTCATGLWGVPFISLFTPLTVSLVAISTIVSALLIGRLAMRNIAGLTGDVIGASVVCAEITIMAAIIISINLRYTVFGLTL